MLIVWYCHSNKIQFIPKATITLLTHFINCSCSGEIYFLYWSIFGDKLFRVWKVYPYFSNCLIFFLFEGIKKSNVISPLYLHRAVSFIYTWPLWNSKWTGCPKGSINVENLFLYNYATATDSGNFPISKYNSRWK